ncbi:MAG: ABC transporter ATP-binding protein, partial [Clostridia bacterium]|nr:ABC transporter ATP-binding protein [Clostridia bacterium]
MSLSVSHLTFAYDKTPVLNDVSFTLGEGTLLAILGPNGVGKTTLFRCILGEQKRYSGTIEIDGAEIKALGARALAHRIAYIPQTHAPAFRFSVRDMVLMGT